MRTFSNLLGIAFTAIMLFSSLSTIGSASLDGTYVPVSMSFDYSPYGDYLGFCDEDNDPYLIAYYDDGPSDISSSDSLLSESWAVEVLIDDDDDTGYMTPNNYYCLEDGYDLYISQVSATRNEVLLNIRKNGDIVDSSVILEEGEIYVYRTRVDCGSDHINNFPVLIFEVDTIFRGVESNAVSFNGIFQVNDNAHVVELDRSVDVSSWIMNITAPNSIQDLTIGIDASATDKLDAGDEWSLPPYPDDKVFLMLDKKYSKNIKSGSDGASWPLIVIVPDGETTSLNWDPDAVDGVNIHVMDGNSEINPGDSISEGAHSFVIYATYGESFDPIPTINIDSPSSTILRDFALSGTIVDDNLGSAQYSVNGQTHTLSYSTSNGVASFEQDLTLEDGEYVIEVTAFDSGSTNKSVSFEIDNTVPDTNMSVDVRGDNALISLCASDSNLLSVVQCTVTGTDYLDRDRLIIRNSNEFEDIFKFYDLDVGDYSVTVYVEDCAGNIAYLSDDFEILDTYPPEITINFPEQGVNYTSFPSINVTTDEEATFVYSLNNQNASTTTELVPYIVTGENTLVVYATDLAGNTASKEVTFYYDPVPAVSFIANATSGNIPLSVQFTDTSTNAPLNWSWDFGDGATSTEQNPVHVYNDVGNFTVSLTTFNGTGNASLVMDEYVRAVNESSGSGEPVENSTLAGFDNFKTISISPSSDGTLTDYQMSFDIDYESEMQEDFDDLRFVGEEGVLLPYWIEDKTNSSSAKVWVKVPVISETDGATVKMYYGNSTIESEANGNAVFELFEDFERVDSTTIDNGWTQCGSVEIINGEVYGTGNSYIQRVLDFSEPRTVHYKIKKPDTGRASAVEIRDGTDRYIVTFSEATSQPNIDALTWQTSSSQSLLDPFTINEWYDMELTKTDISSARVSVNGVETTGLTTTYTTTDNELCVITGYDVGSSAYYDDIFVTKYTSSKPTYFVSTTFDSSAFTNNKTIIISPSADGALLDFEMNFDIDYEPEMQEDFDDLRFVGEEGVLLPYWIEEKTNSTSAKVWVKVPVISETDGATVKMYYGNPEVFSAENGNNVFEFFDDGEGKINGNSIANCGWDIEGGIYEYDNSKASSGSMSIHGNSLEEYANYPLSNLSSCIFEFDMYDNNGEYGAGLIRNSANTEAHYSGYFAGSSNVDPTKYFLFYMGSGYQNTGVSRSLGWHHFKLECSPNGSGTLYVDEIESAVAYPIGSLNSIDMVSLRDYSHSDTWWDNIFVHQYVENEPSYSIVKFADTAQFSKNKTISIYPSADGTLLDFQMSFNINYESEMQPDFDDLRFTDEDGVLLPYWTEDKTNSSSAKVWVKVPVISETDGATVKMYYGNSTIESEANGNAVFELFEDFERVDSTTIDNGWTQCGSVEIINGEVYGTGNSYIQRVLDFSEPRTVHYKIKKPDTGRASAVEIRDGTDRYIVTFSEATSQPNIDALTWQTSSSQSLLDPFTINEWYDMELTKTDISSARVSVNGVETTGLTTTYTTTDNELRVITGYDVGSSAYYDDIFVTKYTSSKPTYFVSTTFDSSAFTNNKTIIISPSADGALLDFEMNFDIDYEPEMQEDFDDLRFVGEEGVLLPYWIEDKTNSSSAKVWVKVPVISETDGATVKMYYGNSTIESEANGNAVFELFEDFERVDSTTIDNGWTQCGSVEIINGEVYGTGNSYIQRVLDFSEPRTVHYKIKKPDTGRASAVEIRDGTDRYIVTFSEATSQPNIDALTWQTSSSQSLLDPFTINEWYDMELTKTDISSARVSVNGVETTGLTTTYTTTDNELRVITGYDVGSSAYYDDIFVTKYTSSKPTYFVSTTFDSSAFTNNKTIIISPSADGALLDFEMNFDIDYEPEMQEDFDDLRFVGEEGVLLPYWIEDKTNSSSAKVWVKVPVISETDGATVKMYYGNSTIESEANGNAVFELFEDFERVDSTTIDNGWTQCGSVEIINGEVYGTGNSYIQRVLDFSEPRTVHYKIKKPDTGRASAVEIRDGTDRYIVTFSEATSQPNIDALTWQTSSSQSLLDPFTINEWYDMELTKTDISSARVSVNGVETTGLTTTYTTTDNELCVITGYDVGSSAYYDDIFVTKYTSSKPTYFVSTTFDSSAFTNNKTIIISPSADGALLDFEMNFDIDYEPEMQEDFDDLRFVGEEGVLLPYWIEEKTNSTSAKVWVKVPVISETDGATVKMYYGNPEVFSAENGNNVFEFFDDGEGKINGNSIANCGWDIEGGIYEYDNSKASSGSMSIHGNSLEEYANYPLSNLSSCIFEFDMYDNNGEYGAGLIRNSANTEAHYSGYFAGSSNVDPTKYFLFYMGSGYQNTGVSRSLGWHHFKLECSPNGSGTLYVDEIESAVAYPIGSLNSIDMVSLRDYSHSDTWWDNIFVHQYVENEPSYSIVKFADTAQFSKNKTISIYPSADGTLLDFQMSFNINYESEMQPDFDDLRFTDEDGVLLPYWTEDKTNSSSAKVWVKVPVISETDGATVKMYYGNSTVESEANGNAVFELFEDFERVDSTTIDNGWTQCGSVEIINGEVYGTGNSYIQRILDFSEPRTVHYKIKKPDTGRASAVEIRDGTDRYIVTFSEATSQPNIDALTWQTSSSQSLLDPFTINEWYDMELTKTDISSARVSVNGVETTGLTTTYTTTDNELRVITGYDVGSSAYYDDIFVTKYTSSKPTYFVSTTFDSSAFTNNKTIIVSPSSDGNLTDYQMSFNISYEPEMQTDFGDIRFTDENGILLPYWIEEKTNSCSAKVWVKISEIDETDGAIVKMYYGNPEAASDSNIDDVMLFYDLFEGSSINSSKWIKTQYGTVSHSVSNGVYTSTLSSGPINAGNVLESNVSFDGPIVVHADYYYSPSSGYPYADIFYGTGYSGSYKCVTDGWYYDSHQPTDATNTLVRHYTSGTPETIYANTDEALFPSNTWTNMVFKLGGSNVAFYADGVERINESGNFENISGTVRLSHFTAHYKTGTLKVKNFFVHEYAESELGYSFTAV